jgi:hypothetical protein
MLIKHGGFNSFTLSQNYQNDNRVNHLLIDSIPNIIILLLLHILKLFFKKTFEIWNIIFITILFVNIMFDFKLSVREVFITT